MISVNLFLIRIMHLDLPLTFIHLSLPHPMIRFNILLKNMGKRWWKSITTAMILIAS